MPVYFSLYFLTSFTNLIFQVVATAFIFAFLFVITMMITNFVIQNYGTSGLQFLSTIVGFTDIDPFILSLLTGKYTIEPSHIASAIIISAGSNNILKSIYTFI